MTCIKKYIDLLNFSPWKRLLIDSLEKWVGDKMLLLGKENLIANCPCLEPIHIASVLSKCTFKPEHSEKRDSICNDFSND
jgi:hypothetical protein